jgi:hypothetical protein
LGRLRVIGSISAVLWTHAANAAPLDTVGSCLRLAERVSPAAFDKRPIPVNTILLTPLVGPVTLDRNKPGFGQMVVGRLREACAAKTGETARYLSYALAAEHDLNGAIEAATLAEALGFEKDRVLILRLRKGEEALVMPLLRKAYGSRRTDDQILAGAYASVAAEYGMDRDWAAQVEPFSKAIGHQARVPNTPGTWFQTDSLAALYVARGEARLWSKQASAEADFKQAILLSEATLKESRRRSMLDGLDDALGTLLAAHLRLVELYAELGQADKAIATSERLHDYLELTETATQWSSFGRQNFRTLSPGDVRRLASGALTKVGAPEEAAKFKRAD